ncbi:hypothetical protein DFH09DRAFT_1327760 [Mycena vulgaris]|nr:hypothetical protein DFH09DRAFT_1327760 [Mycena vulgaris]
MTSARKAFAPISRTKVSPVLTSPHGSLPTPATHFPSHARAVLYPNAPLRPSATTFPACRFLSHTPRASTRDVAFSVVHTVVAAPLTAAPAPRPSIPLPPAPSHSISPPPRLCSPPPVALTAAPRTRISFKRSPSFRAVPRPRARSHPRPRQASACVFSNCTTTFHITLAASAHCRDWKAYIRAPTLNSSLGFEYVSYPLASQTRISTTLLTRRRLASDVASLRPRGNFN